MEETEVVQCVFCGQTFELTIDTSSELQTLVTDCEICCRPLKITVDCEPGEVHGVTVEPA